MTKYVYFNGNQKKDYCSGTVYYNFIDYAFSNTDYFMLVYVNYYGSGYSKVMKDFKRELQPYKVKSRTNPRWPGTLNTYCANTSYKVVFYRNEIKAKEILKKVDRLSAWSSPIYPQDLAFFKGNRCWSFSVGHENIAGIINPTDEDVIFLEDNNLALNDNIKTRNDNYFDIYNENIENNN